MSTKIKKIDDVRTIKIEDYINELPQLNTSLTHLL